MAAPTNGYSSPSNGRKPFAHIDDVTSVAVEIDPHTPLRKVLELGDTHMRQAITFSDFRRPDLALQEYIKAFTIAVDKIPKHKDYPSLKNDRSDLSRLYSALKVKITNNSDKFDKIKAEIKEDNLRNGVRSARRASEALLMNLPSVPGSLPNQHKPNGLNGTADKHVGNGFETRPRNGSASGNARAKPAVQPKPQVLHGNTINKPSAGPVGQDLASRFAQLRSAQDASPIPPSGHGKPSGPRDMPNTNRPQPHINSAVPTMPKMPDAIYSPARGTITSEIADLPSSTPRGMFSRTNSIASVSCSSARNSIDIGSRPMATEHSVPTQSTHENGTAAAPASPRIQIPPGNTITPEQLQGYMQKGASVVRLLIIDVRTREEFDDGHIMSQNTICVEPSVLARGDISADDIEESMGIAPDEEMKAFENRAKFDLVVFYDEESTKLPENPRNDEDGFVLFTLYQALDHFNYGRELRNKPKLLRGGVEAWTDIFGRYSLQESKTSAAIKDGKPKPDLSRFKPGYNNRRRARAQTKALRPEEIKEFERKLREDEAAARSPQEYVRSTQDFLRRFPSASEIQQSMSSQTSGSQDSFESDLPPAPPTRPAPAVPRTSYSGLSTKSPESDVPLAKTASSGVVVRDRPTGLINPHNNCFANSAIQAILASPGFAPHFASKDWPTSWKPADDNPQLMARILGNLIQWLAGKQFESMQPTTFMKYCQSIHEGYRLPGSNRLCKFGDGTQHDASEFLFDFVFSQLDNETNRSRNTQFVNYSQPGEELKKKDKKRAQALPLISLAFDSWNKYMSFRDTVMTWHWGVLHVDRNVCRTCRDSVDSFGYSNYLDLGGVSGRYSDEPMTLKQLLDEQFNSKETRQADGDSGYECGTEVGEIHKSKEAYTKLVRLPPLLAIRFKRWDAMGNKVKRKIKFDVDNLDLTEYTIDTSDITDRGTVNGFSAEKVYDLYAVIAHRGDTSSQGHYVSYVKDGASRDASAWFFCNDQHVYKRRVGSPTMPLEDVWFQCLDGFTPFVIFYKRRDVPWQYARPPAGMR
ncbi:hypothetical protein JX265_001257 [Neoarthrinium moseri]|uniref:Uncharacterized protein n=1 Tax=Neoarthrinium moseri TaxID=1658444 RepID=A0A9Q0ARQ6_9PEZI|nr:hypothetical protein JX265_001257 [Neoarthrinium moseri]